MSFTQNDIESLADKLAQLDLTEEETAVLRNLSGEDEVAGFGMFDFSPLSIKLASPQSEFFVDKAQRETEQFRNQNDHKGIVMHEEQETI